MTNIKPGQVWEVKNTIKIWDPIFVFNPGEKFLILKQTFGYDDDSSWYDIWVDGKVLSIWAGWFTDQYLQIC